MNDCRYSPATALRRSEGTGGWDFFLILRTAPPPPHPEPKPLSATVFLFAGVFASPQTYSMGHAAKQYLLAFGYAGVLYVLDGVFACAIEKAYLWS